MREEHFFVVKKIVQTKSLLRAKSSVETLFFEFTNVVTRRKRSLTICFLPD